MKGIRAKHLPVFLCLALILSFFSGCGEGGQLTETLLTVEPTQRSDISSELTYDHSLELTYADQYAVDFFEEGGCLITVCDDRQYFLPDSSGDVPTDLSEDIPVLPANAQKGYIAATASMDFFASIDALDALSFSSAREENWKIDEAVEAMQAGNIVYAGKYSAPDYELLTSEGCDLAIENTMIYHSPDVIRQLESLGIPVFIDNASNEKTPEGRMEWIKLYGVLTGKLDAAEEAFARQETVFLEMATQNVVSGDTVAFFSIRSNGTVSVRRSTDYIPAMIQIAGGEYVFSDLGSDSDSNRSTEVISMEEFYTVAKDADWLIYNSTIEGERNSLEDLLQDAPVLADCKAVKEEHVYCTTADFYQHSMGQGDFVRDLYEMMNGGSEFTYLFQLN